MHLIFTIHEKLKTLNPISCKNPCQPLTSVQSKFILNVLYYVTCTLFIKKLP